MSQLFVSVPTGREFYGHEITHRGSCVYIGAEDVSGFKVRLRSAKQAAGLPPNTPIGAYTFPESIDLRDAVSVASFTRFLQESVKRPLEVIVIDTYSASMPGATENSSEDTSTAMAHAHLWRELLQTTVLIVHHTNAGGTRERGHSAMRGAADFMISMTPVAATGQPNEARWLRRNGLARNERVTWLNLKTSSSITWCAPLSGG